MLFLGGHWWTLPLPKITPRVYHKFPAVGRKFFRWSYFYFFEPKFLWTKIPPSLQDWGGETAGFYGGKPHQYRGQLSPFKWPKSQVGSKGRGFFWGVILVRSSLFLSIWESNDRTLKQMPRPSIWKVFLKPLFRFHVLQKVHQFGSIWRWNCTRWKSKFIYTWVSAKTMEHNKRGLPWFVD